MTNAHGSAIPLGVPSEEEDDHDLLTYAIAADRLRQEIANEQKALADALDADDRDAHRIERVRQRLEQLNRVLERHVAAREGHVNERAFFGEETP